MPLCVAVAAEKHAYTEWVQWKKKWEKYLFICICLVSFGQSCEGSITIAQGKLLLLFPGKI